MPENPNPQGKGQVPVLAALAEGQRAAAAAPAKHVEQVSVELFTSLFATEDMREGIEAFYEDREPDFTGE